MPEAAAERVWLDRRRQPARGKRPRSRAPLSNLLLQIQMCFGASAYSLSCRSPSSMTGVGIVDLVKHSGPWADRAHTERHVGRQIKGQAGSMAKAGAGDGYFADGCVCTHSI